MYKQEDTPGELLPDINDGKQLALESTGIFAGQSQELDFTLSSLNTLWVRLLYVTLTKGRIQAVYKFGNLIQIQS
jgi:hypothetical protein